MGKVHGSKTFVSVGGSDISEFTNTSEFPRERETHDVTGYGADDHAYSKGLKDKTFTMSGVYDNTAGTGPRAVLLPLYEDDSDTLIEIIRRPEGTGSGKPQDVFDAICTNYTETNPVADMVAWSAEFQGSGPVDSTPQS